MENLHRADLTTLQRDEQIAEWIRITELIVSAQVAQKVDAAPKVGRPAGGLSAVAREIGVESTAAKRAVKVAGLTSAAKKAARDEGLDNSRRARTTDFNSPQYAL